MEMEKSMALVLLGGNALLVKDQRFEYLLYHINYTIIFEVNLNQPYYTNSIKVKEDSFTRIYFFLSSKISG